MEPCAGGLVPMGPCAVGAVSRWGRVPVALCTFGAFERGVERSIKRSTCWVTVGRAMERLSSECLSNLRGDRGLERPSTRAA